MKKHTGYLISIFMAAAMLCGLNGCSEIDTKDDAGQTITEDGDKENVTEVIFDKTEQAEPIEGSKETEQAVSGEDLDVVVPNPADDDWYMKGNIYTDDKGNQLEVFFNDYGTLEFAVNGISMYITTVDNFPGEPAHIEIGDGDYAGLYEEGGDKVN